MQYEREHLSVGGQQGILISRSREGLEHPSQKTLKAQFGTHFDTYTVDSL